MSELNTELTHEGIQDVVTLTKQAIEVTYIESKHDLAVLPEGKEITDLERFHAHPKRIKQEQGFIDTGSFTTYVNKFKNADTILRGDQTQGQITASIDYHSKEKASWNTHSATLKMQKTEDWKAFAAQNGRAQGQADFARFIERYDHCIIEPDSATLIEMIEKMDVASGMTFESKVNRTDGSLQFTYKDEKQLVGTLKVPTKFYISVAPFEANTPQTVAVLLRYRISDGNLSFFYDLPEFAKVEREAFLAACGDVTKDTALPVLR